MGRVFRFLIFYFLMMGEVSFAQVGLVQWSDDHSSYETLGGTVAKIVELYNEFRTEYPRGEFIVYALGDHSGINAYSSGDHGRSSIESLLLLKRLGMTVVFTPGNHDAFDWNGAIDIVDHFQKQMKVLFENGVVLLGGNFEGLRPPFTNWFESTYPLRSIKPRSVLAGFAIPELVQKSSMYTEQAKEIFESVIPIGKALKKLLFDSRQTHTENVYLGAHIGFQQLSNFVDYTRQIKSRHQTLRVNIPLAMAAHDHRVVAYRSKGTLFSDGGSYGTFNYIMIQSNGEIIQPIQHFSHDAVNSAALIKKMFSFGELHTLDANPGQFSDESSVAQFQKKIARLIAKKNVKLMRPVVETKEIPFHKFHLKRERNALGDMLANTLVAYAQSELDLDLPIIAMVNSSSYRLQKNVPAGAITEKVIRDMYTYLSDSQSYIVTREEAEIVYSALKRFYNDGGSNLHTPQLNSDVEWQLVGNNYEFVLSQFPEARSYDRVLLVLDGWLAEHSFGESYKVPEVIKILRTAEKVGEKAFQQILVEYFAQAHAKSPFAVISEPKAHQKAVPSCQQLVLDIEESLITK